MHEQFEQFLLHSIFRVRMTEKLKICQIDIKLVMTTQIMCNVKIIIHQFIFETKPTQRKIEAKIRENCLNHSTHLTEIERNQLKNCNIVKERYPHTRWQ